jgi:hypothetical protein
MSRKVVLVAGEQGLGFIPEKLMEACMAGGSGPPLLEKRKLT